VRAGGVPDLILDGQTGVLAEPGDEGMADFTEKVRSLVEDRALRERLGVAARAEAERWSWEAATSMLRNEKYRKAISRHDKAMAEAGIDSGRVRPRRKPRWLVWLMTAYIIVRVRCAARRRRLARVMAWHPRACGGVCAPRLPARADCLLACRGWLSVGLPG
jgi:hypothetical protein